MKILDRYILWQFLVPWVYCFLAFTMVYIVFDLFNNLGDFIQGHASLLSLIRYYLWVIPASLIYIMPVSLVLALLWSLSRLTRHNELTAMRACGLSLLRLMAPLFVVGILASLIVLGVNETVGSTCAYLAKQFVRAQGRSDKESVWIAEFLPYQNRRAYRTWLIRRFDTVTGDMEGVEVVQQTPQGRDAWKAMAERATWTGGQWWFEKVTIQYYDEHGHPRGVPRHLPVRVMTEFDETPKDFLAEVKDPEFLTAAEIFEYIRGHPDLSPATVRRLTVDAHARWAMPWGCLVAILFGIPFGTTTGRQGAIRGVMLCLGLFFSSWVLVSLGLWAGKRGLFGIPPWLAGWGPTLLYLVIGAVLALRIR